MADFTFNPYPQIGTQLTTGMDAVSGALTPASTVDDLVNAVYNYIQPIYYPAGTPGTVPKQLEIELKSVIYNMINAYNNKFLGSMKYDRQQYNFIGFMLGSTTTTTTPINALGRWLLDIEDNISNTTLSIDKQTPLLLAIMCGKAINTYWPTKVATPGTWTPFFQPPAPLNYANIPLWVAACLEGALLGANASEKGLIAPTTDIVSVNIISALIGALTIGAGKVVFKWVPRIQPRQIGPKVLPTSGGLSLTASNISVIGTPGVGTGNNPPITGKIISWVGSDGNGNVICDIAGPNGDEWCNVPDAGVHVGQLI